MNDWKKASLGGEAHESLEVRTADDMVEIRDPDTGDIIVRTTPRKWAAFLLGVKAGEFDHFVA
ncbi:DUF397 domain-containing protein [Kitasatospora sp. NBC_01246]|uniref:DUF397 domain-containing protein n=1 Tax=Kitasatospora sp. NBC_01246 TaxID=2903570 RepID=UPI002E2F0F85|nr:DUF397 domain-containing protein [Kitasatospora sp. NBC_01246]